jgi:hypothetical protein
MNSVRLASLVSATLFIGGAVSFAQLTICHESRECAPPDQGDVCAYPGTGDMCFGFKLVRPKRGPEKLGEIWKPFKACSEVRIGPYNANTGTCDCSTPDGDIGDPAVTPDC